MILFIINYNNIGYDSEINYWYNPRIDPVPIAEKHNWVSANDVLDIDKTKVGEAINLLDESPAGFKLMDDQLVKYFARESHGKNNPNSKYYLIKSIKGDRGELSIMIYEKNGIVKSYWEVSRKRDVGKVKPSMVNNPVIIITDAELKSVHVGHFLYHVPGKRRWW